MSHLVDQRAATTYGTERFVGRSLPFATRPWSSCIFTIAGFTPNAFSWLTSTRLFVIAPAAQMTSPVVRETMSACTTRSPATTLLGGFCKAIQQTPLTSARSRVRSTSSALSDFALGGVSLLSFAYFAPPPPPSPLSPSVTVVALNDPLLRPPARAGVAGPPPGGARFGAILNSEMERRTIRREENSRPGLRKITQWLLALQLLGLASSCFPRFASIRKCLFRAGSILEK